jgi:membrane protease YdiL (CAAX protease family)
VPAPPAAAPSVAGRVLTTLSALILLTLVTLLVWLSAGEPRVTSVENPEAALALIVGRTLDVQTALAEGPAWERRLYSVLLTDTSSEIDQAIDWHEELAVHSLAPDVDLRLAILLGEAGRHERLERVVAAWPSRGEPLATWASALAAAYLGAEDFEAGSAVEALSALRSGWFADALARRLALRFDEPAIVEGASRAIAARAAPLLWRLRALIMLDAVLLAAGVLALVALRRRADVTVADAALPPPWSLGTGLATLLRGGALAALGLVMLLIGYRWLAERPLLTEALDQPLMYLPVLLLTWRALLVPARLGFLDAFGLRLRPGAARVCVLALAALVAAGIVIDLGLSLLGGRFGLTSHWAEWFDADIAWGSPAAVGVSLLGAVIFAPVFEELIFRGLLYGTLRTRLRWPVAALATALVFAAAHGYGVAGFISVLLSGLLWSYAYERTASLLPAIAAHVLNNATVALTLMAVLR